jgi:hypothetical protein
MQQRTGQFARTDQRMGEQLAPAVSTFCRTPCGQTAYLGSRRNHAALARLLCLAVL